MVNNPSKMEIHLPGKENLDNFVHLADLNMPKITNSDASILRIAQVTKIDLEHSSVSIFVLADQQEVSVQYPGFMIDWTNGTGFWHGLSIGDVVLCLIGFGNKHYILNKIGNALNNFQLDGFSGESFDSLFFESYSSYLDTDFKNVLPGDYLLKSGNNNKLKLSKIGSFLGNAGKSSLTFDISDVNASQNGTAVLEANQKYEFSNSGYSIEGIVLRDRRIKSIDGESTINPRIIFQWYKDLQPVAFDPSLQVFEKTNDKNPRNPAFVEQKNVIFEFSDYNFDNPIESDEKESNKQSVDSRQTRDPAVSRRARKNDTFNLSLISPNYLIEEIKGTAVDTLGNIIDINRTILPIGDPNGIVKLEKDQESYYKIRDLHRKSIAFHWELNARKDKESTISVETKDKNSYGDIGDIYKRNRSRFFLDIDKEGQIKLNVPCSSETGNIPVLARYENYSTIYPNEKKGVKDYDYFSRTSDTTVDILLDSFGKGVVDLSGNSKLLPKDRITGDTIKLGTMFHDISTTCIYPFKTLIEGKYQGYGILSGPDTMVENANQQKHDILENTITDKEDPLKRTIITKEINIEGENANAGGRSATLNFEGMLNTSIGANTVDRQSLWLDTQGGIVSRIGADKNGISMATQTDGDVYWQIGGEPLGEEPDKRFEGINDTWVRTNRFEIRVMQGNGPSFTRILIDNRGLIVTSPEDIEFRSEKNLIFYAGADMHLNCEGLLFYNQTVKQDDVRPSKQSRNTEDFYVQDIGARKVERNQNNPVA